MPTLTVKSLEPWKSDLRRMTKIYRDVPSEGEDLAKWREARKLFVTFTNNWDEWVYKVLLPKTDPKSETALAKHVRKTAWDARIALDASRLFEENWDSRSDTHQPSPWKLKSIRDTNIRRYQKAFGEAFEAIEEYLTQQGGTVDRYEREDHFEVSGMNVVLRNWGRDGENTDKAYRDKILTGYLHDLNRGVKKIESAGFGLALKGLDLFIDFDSQKGLTLGQYSPSKDELTIFALGLAIATGEGGEGHGTFSHEIGHRFWFRNLSSTAREAWSEALTANSAKIEAADVETFFNKVIKPNAHPEHLDRHDLAKLVEKLAPTDADRVKWLELADISPASAKEDWKYVPESYRERLLEDVGEVVHLEHISEYARTNPIEAFADVFRLWVEKGPGALGPWTRDLFKRIVGTGGVRLANTISERVAHRWLASWGE